MGRRKGGREDVLLTFLFSQKQDDEAENGRGVIQWRVRREDCNGLKTREERHRQKSVEDSGENAIERNSETRPGRVRKRGGISTGPSKDRGG